ncbi:MAG: MutS domain [archaeon]|jgi:hypothetical protein
MKYSLADLFEYIPGSIRLTGFPSSPIFDTLRQTLGKEALLSRYQTEDKKKKVVTPSFSLEYRVQRQRFFQKLTDETIESDIFKREFQQKPEGRGIEHFFDFCEEVYTIINDVYKVLQNFGHLPEAKNIRAKLASFDKDLHATLQALNTIQQTKVFAYNTENGVIVPMKEMPHESKKLQYKAEKADRWTIMGEDMIDEIKIKMKKAALSMTRYGTDSFKRRIKQFVEDEFSFDEDNLRGEFEQLALPIRLYAAYRKFLQTHADIRDEEDLTTHYPQFSDHYHIENLLPLNLLRTRRDPIPINFKTKPKEKKFMIAGLHSGGKSFFLENLVLASVIGQIPLPLPAGRITLPHYRRIFYYRNQNNGGGNDGKLIGEVKTTENIIQGAGEEDAIFLDEFLDSVSTASATYLVPVMLERLEKSRATLFVSSHRNVNYRSLIRRGWTILSPDYQIQNGKVVPAHKIKRGIPSERINKRFVAEKCEGIFNPDWDDFEEE